MTQNTSKSEMIHNLKAAGCDDALIESFISDMENGKNAAGKRRLTEHRRRLLDTLHEEQRRLDCLDYLLYMMRKQEMKTIK